MNLRPKQEFVRLILGLLLNLALWFVFRELALFSTVDREFRIAFLGGCIASATLVIVIPIFWKGKAWHAPIAFLMLWLPAIVFWQVFGIVLQYR